VAAVEEKTSSKAESQPSQYELYTFTTWLLKVCEICYFYLSLSQYAYPTPRVMDSQQWRVTVYKLRMLKKCKVLLSVDISWNRNCRSAFSTAT